MRNRYNKKHGHSNSRLYRIYNNMKSRCYRKYAKEFENYGGRGIRVCNEWLGEDGFVNFYNWAYSHGYSEELTIDRINNDGNYEPDNCRWVTMMVQNSNSRHTHMLEYKGTKKNISEWAREKGMSRDTLIKRLRSGWELERVLNEPVNKSFSRKSVERRMR